MALFECSGGAKKPITIPLFQATREDSGNIASTTLKLDVSDYSTLTIGSMETTGTGSVWRVFDVTSTPSVKLYESSSPKSTPTVIDISSVNTLQLYAWISSSTNWTSTFFRNVEIS